MTGAGSTANFNIYGDLNLSGGTWTLGGAGTTQNINVYGNTSMTSGTISTTGATSIMNWNLKGNHSMSGGTTVAGGASGSIILNISGNSTFSGTAAMTNTGAGCTSSVYYMLPTASGTMLINNTSTGAWTKTNAYVNAGCTAQLNGNYSTTMGTAAFGLNVNGTLICPAAYVVNGTRVFALNSGATLVVAHATGINGAITTTGTLTLSAGANYTFNGSVAQVTGTLLPTALVSPSVLTISNSSGVTLSQNTSTTGTLAFTAGILNTGAFTMTTPGAAGAVTGAGATSYVNGTLSKTIAGLTSVNYEVGDLNYAPMSLALSAAGTSGNLAVKVFNGLHPNIATSGISSLSVVNHYWRITNLAAAGPATIIPTGTYNSGDIIGGSNIGFMTQKYTAAAWLGTGLASTNTSAPYRTTPLSGITLATLAGDYIFGNTNCGTAPITGTTSVCVGGTTTLADITPSGAWNSASTGIATVTSGGVVTGVATGTAIISYTASSCTVTTVVTVTPSVGPITGPATVCMGATITLSGSVPGGTWTSGFTPVATVGLSNGVVTGMGVGGAPITYAVGGCIATTTIGVNANPAPIDPSAPIALCVGGTATVTDASTGTWSSSPSTTASISSGGLVTGLTAGIAIISFTNSDGCSATKNVTVNANPPAIGGSLNVCAGSTGSLTNSVPGGTWSISAAPGVATIGSASGVLSGLSVGTGTVTYTVSTSCYITATISVGTAPGAITGPTALCAGGATISLSNSVPGGTWTSGAGSIATVASSGVVSSVSPGTAVISYATSGCAPATYTITVNPLPSPIGGILGVCNGTPSSLYDATPGGSWSSSDVSIATVSGAGVLSGVLPGTATISYAMPGGCFITSIVTINPTAPILGSDSICAGGTGYLTNIVGGGTWSSSNPAVSDVGLTTGVLTTYVPGPTYIYYILPSGCSVTRLITVIPALAPISGPGRVCTGSVTTLGHTTPGGTWSSSNTYVATIGGTTGILVSGFPDEVSITYTLPGVGCTAVSVMTVDPLPVPVISYSGNATHTLSTFPYYTSYQWYDSSAGLIPGANTMSHVIPTNVSEDYYVVVTDNNGCTGSYVYRYVTRVGVSALGDNGVSIYPNPATDRVIINSSLNVTAVISDVAGRKQVEQENAKEINVAQLAPGVYIVTLYDAAGVIVAREKLVKQ